MSNLSAVDSHVAADVLREPILPYDLLSFCNVKSQASTESPWWIDEIVQVMSVDVQDNRRRVTIRTLTGTTYAFWYPCATIVPKRLARPLEILPPEQWQQYRDTETDWVWF